MMMRRKPAGAALPPVSGYHAWWDFSDVDSLTLDASEIVEVADKAAGNYPLSRSATGPVSDTSSRIGGGVLRIARFGDDGVITALSRDDASGVGAAWTLFVTAVKQTQTMTGGSADYLARVDKKSLLSEDPYFMRYHNGAYNNISDTPWGILNPGTWVVRIDDDTQSAWRGTELRYQGAAAIQHEALTTFGAHPVVIANWEVGEVLIYNSALSDEDRLSVTEYLATKWGAR